MARATRIALDLALATSKALKPAASTAWKYAKIEMIPPFTSGFFHGPGGQKLEEFVSQTTDGLIINLQNTIKTMDAEKERLRKQKEEAIKAAQEKQKAEAKKAQEQAIQKATEAKKALKENAEKKIETQKKESKNVESKAKEQTKTEDKKKSKSGTKK